MKKICVLMLLFSCNIFAQNFSFGFDYSGLITGKNYESASMYTIEGDYGFLENTFSAGFSASLIRSRINKTFINNPSPDSPFETSFKLGLQWKYYPFLFQKDSFTLRSFIGIECGVYSTSHIQTYLNMPGSCAEYYYFFESQNDFYANISIGALVSTKQPLNFLFGMKYQINNPTVKYEKPNCSDDGEYSIGEPTKYTEKVNLNMFLWTLGFRINF